MITIWAPIAYLSFLVISFVVFSKIYRARSKGQIAPWFGPHIQRDVYISLLSMEPPAPAPILMAALVRRAMENVRRIQEIKEAKNAMHMMLQKGQIGDSTWEKLLVAEKELEAEIVEVVEEANEFQPGYAQGIFQLASDMVQHEKWKKVHAEIPAGAEKAKQPTFTPVLAPYTHISPSELSLSLSNPITNSTPAPNVPSLQVPEISEKLPTAPPTRVPTPIVPPPATKEEAPKEVQESEAETIKPTPASIAAAAAKKSKGKKKKPVKGGR